MLEFINIAKSFFQTIYSKKRVDTNPPTIILQNGTKEWWTGEGHFKEGDWIIHRENGPAVVYSVGEEWFYQGLLHREGGPAILYGLHQEWYKHGKRHRLNGPALETTEDTEICMRYEWWIEGIQYTKEEFQHEIAKKRLNKSLDIELNENTQKIKKNKI